MMLLLPTITCERWRTRWHKEHIHAIERLILRRCRGAAAAAARRAIEGVAIYDIIIASLC